MEAIPPHFELLVQVLAERIGAPLDAAEGSVVLADDAGAMQLAIELAADEKRIYAVVPVVSFEAAQPLGESALQLLQLNADREALRGATVAADGAREQFCLIQEMPLDTDPVAFIEWIESLATLSRQLRATVVSAAPGTGDAGLAALMQQRV